MEKPIDGSPITNGQSAERFLRVSDTKTRDVPTIPPERNSTQARTQLMLYHRLLSGIIQSSSDLGLNTRNLDFDAFWLRIGIDPYVPFSDGFCEQTGLPAYDVASHTPEQQGSTAGNEDAKRAQFCLHTLVDEWKETLRRLEITSVDPTLTVNYRKRETSRRKRRRRANDSKRRATDSQEEKELNQAIIASLAQADHEDPALACAIAESLRYAQASGTPVSEQAPSQPTGSPSKRDAESDPDETGMKSDNRTEDEKDRGSEVIGSTSFVMDDAALDVRLEKVLEWWHGIRRPEGVELEDTGRCQYVLSPLTAQFLADVFAYSSCEFSTSCEWREKKSNEFLSKLRSRSRDAA